MRHSWLQSIGENEAESHQVVFQRVVDCFKDIAKVVAFDNRVVPTLVIATVAYSHSVAVVVVGQVHAHNTLKGSVVSADSVENG